MFRDNSCFCFVCLVRYVARERSRGGSRREVTKIPSIPIGIVFILRTSTYMTDVNYLYSTIFSVKGITSLSMCCYYIQCVATTYYIVRESS